MDKIITKKQVTAIIAGAGGRGKVYASYAKEYPDKLKVVGVADPKEFCRNEMAEDFDIPVKNVYKSWEDIAARDKFADVAIIATPDAMHVGPAVALADRGYHMLLEKPLAPTWEGCKQIANAVRNSGKLFCTAHVLKYTPYTRKLKELLDSGIIGEIACVQHLEPVGYWHQAHTFVRGNGRNTAESSFMLLQKSCHDFDWLNYIIGADCKEVSSFGNLKHFKKENKPPKAGMRCVDCAIEKQCPYSAVKIYIRDRTTKDKNYLGGFPVAMLTSNHTLEVMEALKTGPYGRCVYECDNDVVDNQVVNMLFENDVTVTFTMTAFTEAGRDRVTKIFGTKGQLKGNGKSIVHYEFLTEQKTEYSINLSCDNVTSGHGGGDFGIIEDFVEAIATNNGSKIVSGLKDTMESHRIVFAAEKARLQRRVVRLDEF